MKLMDCSAHSVLSVKAVMVTVYSVTASRPERIACVSVVSPTADVPFCQSMRYMKDHMSAVDGRSHSRSTLGGIWLATEMFTGGPGQSMVDGTDEHTIVAFSNIMLNIQRQFIVKYFHYLPTHGSDGCDSLTLPVPSMQGHTLTTPPGEELIVGQG